MYLLFKGRKISVWCPHAVTVQGAAVATPAGFGALPWNPYAPQNVVGAHCCNDTHRT